MPVPLTLCLVHRNNQLLLGLKKRGFGAGRWNGFGGKLKEGEDLEIAVRREVWEECGLTVEKLEKKGIMTFRFPNGKICEVHLYKALNHTGEPQESAEMVPQWFDINQIPYDQMWSSDKHWLPFFLADKKLKAKFVFDKKDQVIDYQISEVDAM